MDPVHPTELIGKYQNVARINLDKISEEEKHAFRLDIEKFTLFVAACFASMKDR